MESTLPLSQLRKLTLERQGLLRTKPFGSGKNGVLEAIRHLGYVQIDTISVVERAHHHVLWTRVPGYRAASLEGLVAEKQVFEYWFHAAAYLPMEDYRFALPRMNAIRSGEKHWFKNTDKKLMKEICKRIQTEGPLMARDFIEPVNGQSGWWDWKPAKQALEQLFIQGELMVVGRSGFQKRYDITERALPESVDTRCPSLYEQAQHLVDVCLRSHGFATLRAFTYLRKGAGLRKAVKEVLNQSIADGTVVKAGLPCKNEVYCDAAALTVRPRPQKRVSLLSPFDSCVIQRDRCRMVYGFDYQIECYVPGPKRRYGYFCLPILYADQLVGRVDCKAERKGKVLNVQSLYLEGFDKQLIDNADRFLHELARAITKFTEFNLCTATKVHRVVPGNYKTPLIKLLSSEDVWRK